jgi:hypothetical protein
MLHDSIVLLSVGDFIECDYDGKHRIGHIVEIKGDVIRVQVKDGYRCFKANKIQNLFAIFIPSLDK